MSKVRVPWNLYWVKPWIQTHLLISAKKDLSFCRRSTSRKPCLGMLWSPYIGLSKHAWSRISFPNQLPLWHIGSLSSFLIPHSSLGFWLSQGLRHESWLWELSIWFKRDGRWLRVAWSILPLWLPALIEHTWTFDTPPLPAQECVSGDSERAFCEIIYRATVQENAQTIG